MPNLSGGGQNQNMFTPWKDPVAYRLPAAIPASGSLIFYPSQAVMRDANGNVIQCDDTVKGEFIGFLIQTFDQTVSSTELVEQNAIAGDEMLNQIDKPHAYLAQIASVQAGQEGQKVFWLFNNQVQVAPTNQCNFAGWIDQIFDSTHVWVTPPWLNRDLGNGQIYNSAYAIPNTAYPSGTSYTCSKWDVGRNFYLTPTGPFTFTLPPLSVVSNADRIGILLLTSGIAVTVNGNGSTINGAATYSFGSTQYNHASFETDGVTGWYAA